MPIHGNFKIDPPPCPLPNWENLVVDEGDEISSRELEALLDVDVSANLKALRIRAEKLLKGKMLSIDKIGGVSDAFLQKEQEAWKAYIDEKWRILGDEKFHVFTDAVHRGELDLRPYEMTERSLNHPYPGFTTGWTSNWPGHDVPYRDFLRKHEAHNHFPKKMGGLGICFTSPVGITREQNLSLLKDMRRADPLFIDAPIVFLNTTRRDLNAVLSHFDRDMPAAVVGKDKKELLGFVWRKDKEDNSHSSESQMVGDFYESIGAPNAHGIEFQSHQSIDPNEAYLSLREKKKKFIYRTDDQDIHRVMTRVTAGTSSLMPPFVFREGLGSIVYIGVSNPEQAIKDLHEYVAFGVAGIIIETAHADRNDVKKFLIQVRKLFPDLFIIVGTVTDPKAVREFLELGADSIKVCIAGGGHCETKQTGVGIPDAWTAIVCGMAAEGKGTIIVDGWGDPREYCLRMAMRNTRGAMGGGALSTRAESPMPVEVENGVRSKLVRGEASAPADRDRQLLRTENVTGIELEREIKRDMANDIHPYWEGKEELNPMRSPLNIGEYAWLCKARLAALASYVGARKNIGTKPLLRQVQEATKIYIAPPIKRMDETLDKPKK